MPFPDELDPTGIHVLPYNPSWPHEFDRIRAHLATILGPIACTIEHIGSTSIPGMAAKNCIDIQVTVADLESPAIEMHLSAHGYRRRPEPWNAQETSFGTACPKQVYAPPVGSRPINVHIRPEGAPNAQYARLFRDYLRANPTSRDAWSDFKTRLACVTTSLVDYGQIKQPATSILMEAAQQWATITNMAPLPHHHP